MKKNYTMPLYIEKDHTGITSLKKKRYRLLNYVLFITFISIAIFILANPIIIPFYQTLSGFVFLGLALWVLKN
jgi:hypothetical protein